MAMAASFSKTSIKTAIMLLMGVLLLVANLGITGHAESVGVCYGMMGNNLPSHSEVISLYRSNKIKRMRLYDPNHGALEALRNSDIEVMLGVPNSDLQSLASNPSNAQAWVQKNVLNFRQNVRFKYIAVGNEVSPVNGDTRLAQFLLPAMQNVYQAIRSAGLHDQIKVSTAIDTTMIGNSYPPSKGSFRNDVRKYLDPILGYLVYANAPLLANIYTYFSYAGNPRDISLPYALFTSPSVLVWDDGKGYQNLFDAMLDALYSALPSFATNLEVVVSESGWPSAGGFGTSDENARTYLSNLIRHVKKGTPKRPGKPIETYLFALFDENQKNPELEKHFGLFSSNKQPKYNLNFGGPRLQELTTLHHNATIPLKSDM